ncbi:hypothetical protein [Streptomyces poonensis]|uniref:DUF2867 domain-containing protein n=1 Tax=Streptomyces poonensis TaxID=68255 RepID=A0A918Q8L3_9ACTN|nr:hypothetical protein [Streptomyces poonensis]GGZ35708.1 hypothetical protein GCM10010365_65720 [Streptomyces poonensis]GLJ89633.1 hypothetical protein GCM10017589_22330 [Streptomyces poonensis]
MSGAALPYVDEHVTLVAAGAGDAWRGLAEALEQSFSRTGAAGYARLVGCAEVAATGPRPLAEGSTLPGFRVTEALPERKLVLEGRHRFSTYAFVFRVEPDGAGRSRVRAETRAVFPGAFGALYRWFVIRTGGHAYGVRNLLSAVRRGAESPRFA